MFTRFKTCSRPGAAHNEDAFAVSPAFLLAVDGATGLQPVHLTGAPTDTGWFSRRTAELLAERLPDMGRELPDILRSAADVLRRELDGFGYAGHEDAWPSASVSVLRVRPPYLEGYVLGDCPALVRTAEGVRLFRDEAVPRRDREVLAWMAERQRAEGLTFAQARDLAAPLLLKNRLERNREGAYWIFEPVGAGVDHALTFSLPLEAVTEAALLTDGFFAYYDTYALAGSCGELLDALASRPLDALADAIRGAERGDPAFARYPRLKPSDDATAVYARLTG